MAARTFWRSDRSFSKNVATRLSTSSSTPPTSPARTMLTMRVLNVSGSLSITVTSLSSSIAPATARPDASLALYLNVAMLDHHLFGRNYVYLVSLVFLVFLVYKLREFGADPVDQVD